MTYRWEPTTPLDRILEAGFKRMDEAVEGVIDRLKWESPMDNLMKQKFRINTDVVYIDHMNKSHVYPRGSVMTEHYLNHQREHNYRMALAAERAALAPRPDWRRMGFTDDGNQLTGSGGAS